MDISELPQTVIDKYFLQIKTNSNNIQSKWTTSFQIISIRNNPYWRLLFKDSDYIYKIFDNDIIIKLFNIAIEKNFFDGIAKIENYIKYNGKYVGYVYPICDKVENLHLSQEIIFNLEKQANEFKDLYKKLEKNTKSAKIFYTDLYYTNIVKYEDQYYLIDIDSLSYLNNNTLTTIDKKYTTLPIFYKNFIKKQMNKKFMTRKQYRKINYH